MRHERGRTHLDLSLGEESRPDPEPDELVARHRPDGAAHEGAALRVAVAADLGGQRVTVIGLPLGPDRAAVSHSQDIWNIDLATFDHGVRDIWGQRGLQLVLSAVPF